MQRAYRIPDAPGERVSARELDRDLRTGPGAVARDRPILPESPEVQLRRDGQMRWLVVQAEPEALWPRLREFWRTQNLALSRDEPTVGIMETEWAEDRAGIPLGLTQGLISRALGTLYDAGTRDQYRLRVDRLNGATEVFIAHRGAVEHGDPDGQGMRWVMSDPDPQLEAEMLNRLLVFLTTGEAPEGRTRVEETDFERTGQVDLVQRDGRSVLVLRGEPDALWRRLGLALDRTGLLVDEHDRRDGTFLVTYRPDVADGGEAERPGLLRRVFRFGRGEDRRQGERFQVRMIEHGRDLQIEALSIEGERIRDRDARFVLELIQPQLR
ncbi:Outer membrane protein NlpB, lipoprotein component of the protein assembly complex (forms a complex with YaeT, YfiO, and YfgL); Lipoprotein-34 precursor [Thioalkalivibrio nitratireducens DSM 14787]|uniref:Outer membrane protein NlpB, lipoprotein component of the protein assembly complex (Forms a complex with YaeT, YfiO, and YfgL) Lipoprotein-34 n=2 Tax=Thioalkalivibrio nitratireducens TaxID=186931 RepID=L0E363_THIND|nr:Outer membrane protein NlpB, lipoprotein component of the protein assembly complex (forms a complex with YaeT, YfiO, and YfgL); Lipoprotein-34 precursor [Thioalkalivibrio nitratireducens DSM 14787]